jgi:hypothetical protein
MGTSEDDLTSGQDESNDWTTAEEREEDIAQAKALCEQARAGGLRFEAMCCCRNHMRSSPGAGGSSRALFRKGGVSRLALRRLPYA